MCVTNESTNLSWSGPSSTSLQVGPAATDATCLPVTLASPSICAAEVDIQGWCGPQEAVSCLCDKKDDMGWKRKQGLPTHLCARPRHPSGFGIFYVSAGSALWMQMPEFPQTFVSRSRYLLQTSLDPSGQSGKQRMPYRLSPNINMFLKLYF